MHKLIKKISFNKIHKEKTVKGLELKLEKTQKLYREILSFQIQTYSEQTSFFTHYNELYDQLVDKLRIKQLYYELTPKIEAFHRVINEIASEKIEEEKELSIKRQEKKDRIIQTVTYLFLPASLTTGILGMNIPLILNSKNNGYLPITFFVIILGTVMLASVLKNSKLSINTVVITIITLIGLLISIYLSY